VGVKIGPRRLKFIPPQPAPCPECGGERAVMMGRPARARRLLGIGRSDRGAPTIWAVICPGCGLAIFHAREATSRPGC
jgi:hypothetical protein